jgi:hypothetical protein
MNKVLLFHLNIILFQVKRSNNLKLVCFLCKNVDEEAGRLVNDPWIRKAMSFPYVFHKPQMAFPVECGPYPRRECGFSVKGEAYILKEDILRELDAMDPLDTWKSYMSADASDDEIIRDGAQVAWRTYLEGDYLKFNPSFKFERREDRYVVSFFR